MPLAPRLRVPALCTLGLLLVLAAGCSSDDHGPDRPGGHLRPHRKPPAPLTGQDTFFDGTIVAELKTGVDDGPGGQPAGGNDERKDDDGGRRSRHGGGSGMGMGGGGHGKHDGGGPPPGSGGEGGGRPGGMRPMMGSLGPPVMIHLRFTNRGAGRAELYIEDFSSPLGNFAVQPEKLTLEPGQSLETEPMSSQLAGSLTEADATLVLRLAGKAEKKVIMIRTAPAAGKEAGSPPGSAPAPAGASSAPPGK